MPVLLRLPWGGMDTTPVAPIDPNDPANSDPVLANNTWEKIAAASEAGLASSLWSIGDEKRLSIETYGTVTMQIAGFDHDLLSDGTGKAGTTFISKELVGNATGSNLYMPATVTKEVGEEVSKIKAFLPSELQSVLKQVNKVYSCDGSVAQCYLFTPSAKEVGEDGSLPGMTTTLPDDGVMYPLFTYGPNGDQERKKTALKTGLVAEWWTRTGYKRGPSSYTFYINTSGTGAEISGPGSSTKAFCIMFCI